MFCIDVSGSMAKNRINVVKTSCLSTLKLLKEQNPTFKVALIIFSDNGVYFGSGDRFLYTIPLWNTNGKNRARDQVSSLKAVSESYDQMVNVINNLQANGGTKIMSALAHSVLLASNINNSKMIVENFHGD